MKRTITQTISKCFDCKHVLSFQCCSLVRVENKNKYFEPYHFRSCPNDNIPKWCPLLKKGAK
jgi:hypothetical protein